MTGPNSIDSSVLVPQKSEPTVVKVNTEATQEAHPLATMLGNRVMGRTPNDAGLLQPSAKPVEDLRDTQETAVATEERPCRRIEA